MYGIEEEFNLQCLPSVQTGPERLQNILRRLHRVAGLQVVVLVDEYDKPVLDVLENPEMGKANRDYLRDFYGVVKDSDEHVRFVFVTGITIFSKTSFSSGLNNLTDISLSPRYAAICGYTDHDLDTVFAPELSGLDRNEIRRWYNGYHWLGDEKLYNPYDVLLLLEERDFHPYWFNTGEPDFLYRLLMEKAVSPMDLEKREVSAVQLTRLNIANIEINALLFQAGYLTIAEKIKTDSQISYILDYPNLEVQQSMNQGLLEHISGSDKHVANYGKTLANLLGSNNFMDFKEHIQSFLAGIPYQWHGSGGLGRYEAWYASLLFMAFRTAQVDLHAEESSSHGRLDMALFHEGQIFVLEFKTVEDETKADQALNGALTQIRERGHAEKYRDRGGPIHLIGMVFGRQARNLLEIRTEKI